MSLHKVNILDIYIYNYYCILLSIKMFNFKKLDFRNAIKDNRIVKRNMM